MQQIIPLNDLKPHEESTTCECMPQVIFENGEMIVIHHSFDGREEIEEGSLHDSIYQPTPKI